MTYPSSLIGREIPKKPKIVNNVFEYNPARVVAPAEHQTGEEPKKRISKKPPLLPGKRISKTGKTYYEYRRNRSSIKGRVK